MLVAAYLQEKKNQGEITSAAINKELKNVGQGIANVTTSMKQLEKRQPAMIIQTAKEGSTQQARKKFKVTTEGISHVQDMISNPKPRKK
ncbi:MAG: hypothetical protein HC913_23330 [Microscillaceae bacterium]|nr:hypothetical protein [Microscillaceae bacterium]